jgi:predicted dehydrogenase
VTDAAGDVLRVGVIGVGWAGQQHVAAYDALPGAEVAAIAGLEQSVRSELAGRYGVQRHVDRWEELLAVDGLDAVSIAVPTFLHAPIALAALERGLHVLCEKPIARTGAEASSMVEAARTAGRVLDVAFNHRQRGDIQRLKGELDAGRLGRPYYAKAWCCAAPAYRPWAAGSPAPSWPVAARWSTSASTSSTTRCSCSATPR